MQRTIAPASAATRTGVWVGIAAITMSFAAYTSAIVVRRGSVPEWQHFSLPLILYWNALVLIASSVTLDVARRRIGGPFDRLGRVDAMTAKGQHTRLLWLRITLALGVAFLVGQFIAWRQLAAQGVYLATSPSSSFFYVLTVLHALHLIGGLAALSYALRCLSTDDGPRPVHVLSAVSLYWHFMDVLWLYLLLLLAYWV